MPGAKAEIGIVGGTGLYDMPGLVDVEDVTLSTPFGAPSSPVRIGTLAGRRVAFLARHGRHHTYLPTEIPYRANVYALRMLGVRQAFAVSAVGSLREEYAPRHVVVIDQVVDRSRHRPSSFFERGVVAHVGYADPFCPGLRAALLEGARTAGLTAHDRGTYLNMEGPQFSTRAESRIHQSWGCDVVGMTNGTEARLAREAEICYATLAFVTDYDAWREHEAGVDLSDVLRVLRETAEGAARAVAHAVERAPAGDCACRHALATGLITPVAHIPEEARTRLQAILSPYL
ncbi:MAG TPA: S-methyl-5'-thioadenosine phosphorylase [Planctomycetota bacterium]|nr:S-methyl-5'-thioadenosine phosphorylase [Planctomycetota bacterium]